MGRAADSAGGEANEDRTDASVDGRVVSNVFHTGLLAMKRFEEYAVAEPSVPLTLRRHAWKWIERHMRSLQAK